MIAVCVPSGETWKADMAVCFGGLCVESASQGLKLSIINERMCSIALSRNSHVADVFSLRPQPSHILWIDSDQAFPNDALLRLLVHDRDIVGTLYPKKVAPYETVGRLFNDEDYSKGGLQKAQTLGSGFMLVKREVYESFEWPWYEEKWDPTGYTSEDIHFCHKARAAGFDVWCDLDLSREIGHSGNHLVQFGPPANTV